MKQTLLERFVSRGMTVYAIGAQASFYTCSFRGSLAKPAAAYAFERCPYEAHFLVDHVRMIAWRTSRFFRRLSGREPS